ncbi:MAG TPA: ABC transporter permease [Candidatus Saccharibacteria bacterium]|jgi:ABC-2 type transport system permease protein|nr:ABC transporter permease [Candidatus Saccharibacteria bacterium]HMT56161.1 ABC transporter permease [Candidatus Saccharibacteria bacterium]
MMQFFNKQNRALLSELVRTDFKLRYQGSILGYAWSLLRPLFMFAILYTVFTRVFSVGKSVENYPIFLLIGIVMWNFFSEITQQSLGSIVNRGDLIRKIKIPRWLIIISASIAGLINLGLNLIVVLVIALMSHMNLLSTSWMLPLYILELYIFGLGISLILSSLFVKYRDVSYIWEVVLQAGFYATPILYPITHSESLIKNPTVLKLVYSNPVAQAIQGTRNSFVTSDTLTIRDVFSSGWAVFIPLVLIAVLLAFGIWFFKRESRYFAENI